jgi:RNase P subunit RPR2
METDFEYKQVEKKKQRLACPKCGSVLLSVDYQPLRQPNMNRLGYFGTCAVCGFSTRITAWHGKSPSGEFTPQS